MYCRKQEDYPKRIRIGGGKAVHAAKVVHRPEQIKYKPGYYGSNGSDYVDKIIPAHDELLPACEMYTGHPYTELPNTETTTCKFCMRNMGISYKDPKELRNYVLVEKESGYFYKKDGYGGHWVESISEATIYKNIVSVKYAGNVTVYSDRDGNTMSYVDYSRCSKAEKFSKRWSIGHRFDSERLEVRSVRIIVEDAEVEVENSKDGDI
jgi:hypothetical protein